MICLPSLLSYLFLLRVLASAADVEDTTELGTKSGRDLLPLDHQDESFNLVQPSLSESLIIHQESLRILLNTSHWYKTVEDLVNDLGSWEAPQEMKQMYPYYLAGYDYDELPIWIGEIGKWDVRKSVEAGGETIKNFEKYMRQLFYRAIISLDKRNSAENKEGELVFIFDLDQLPITQLTHVPTLAFGLRLLADFAPLFNRHTSTGFLINVNYVAERLIGLSRPILGSVFERIQVYGTNRAQWIPRLLRRLPKDQLPAWYGGTKEFKPVAVYG